MIVRDYQSNDFEAVIHLWWDSWHSSSGYQHHKAIADWKQRWYQLEKTHSIVVIEHLTQIVAFAALESQGCILSPALRLSSLEEKRHRQATDAVG